MNRKEVQENVSELCGRSKLRTDCIVPFQLLATIDIAFVGMLIRKEPKKNSMGQTPLAKHVDLRKSSRVNCSTSFREFFHCSYASCVSLSGRLEQYIAAI
jgi:hypothetical protein